MQARADIIEFFEHISTVAKSAQRKLSYLLVIGLLATAYLGYEVVSAASPLWWNGLKIMLLATPALIWLFVWSVLDGLTQAPATIANLASDEAGVVPELQALSIKKPGTVRGIFSAVRAFHREDGFSVLFDTIGGISMIANPLFAILAFLALPLLIVLILIAVVLLIF